MRHWIFRKLQAKNKTASSKFVLLSTCSAIVYYSYVASPTNFGAACVFVSSARPFSCSVWLLQRNFPQNLSSSFRMELSVMRTLASYPFLRVNSLSCTTSSPNSHGSSTHQSSKLILVRVVFNWLSIYQTLFLFAVTVLTVCKIRF